MRNRQKIKIAITVLVIISTFFTAKNFMLINHQGETERTIENLNPPKISGYWVTNFIHIDGNWSQAVGNYSWVNGDGSWSNPYIIENVTIDASTSPTRSGIIINNSKNDYFIIRNVTVFNAGNVSFDAGIKLDFITSRSF
ncbi:hypothetical protein LCGC14_0753850 [marine sediment metagenome]|uniref:Right handed beta helix domain-containing protein n=1 Tax=marine sediment metagenome TaxID=412755 RepID=A0A0F9TA86_9ZZZZ